MKNNSWPESYTHALALGFYHIPKISDVLIRKETAADGISTIQYLEIGDGGEILQAGEIALKKPVDSAIRKNAVQQMPGKFYSLVRSEASLANPENLI